MSKQPYISIIIPCYNAELFLEQAIESILSQPFENWELLLVNDGSTDNTNTICIGYTEKDERIHLISTANLGAGHARNIGIQNASGKWVLFLDADDLFLSDSITSKLVSTLVEYEQKCDIIYTSIARGTDMNLRETISFYKAERPEDIEYRPKTAFWNGIYKRSFLVETRTFFFEYQEQDVETAFRYVAFHNADRKISRSDIAFYFQRNNALSNTHTWNIEKLHYVKAQVYCQLLKAYSENINRNYLFEDTVEEVHNYYRYCIKAKEKDPLRIRTINKVFFQTINKKGLKFVTKKGEKHYFTNFLFFACANSVPKESVKPAFPEKKQTIEIDATNIILERLGVISNYIRFCLIGDSNETD